MLHRLLPCLLVFSLLVPASAHAHGLIVARPGGAEVDLGAASAPTLIHATLDGKSDRLSIRLAPSSDDDLVFELLVPDIAAEGRATGDELPQASVQVSGAPVPIEAGGEDVERRDTVSGVAYRRIAFLEYGAVTGDVIELLVRRGTIPARVAVRVAKPDASFEATGAERTPKTVVALRRWFDTPPASAPRPAARATGIDDRLVWIPAALALVMLIVAGWWMARGRARARVRGIERDNERR